MRNPYKIHLLDPNEIQDSSYWGTVALCGRGGVRRVGDASSVTCRRCLALLEARNAPGSPLA